MLTEWSRAQPDVENILKLNRQQIYVILGRQNSCEKFKSHLRNYKNTIVVVSFFKQIALQATG